MTNSSVIIVQRQTLDWAALTPDAFKPLSVDFCRLWGKPDDYVFRLMQLWDKTFSVGYFETRARLKAISARNLLSVSGVEFVPYDGYHNIPDKKAFYLFMDDDDWAAPDLGAVLSAQSPDTHKALLWRAVNIGSPQQEYPAFVWGLNGRCMTNNYAVSSVWLNHLQRLDEVTQHAAAATTLAKFPDIVQLDVAITASNKSPCSSVSLDRGLNGDLSPEKLAALVEDYLARMATLLPEHIWMAQWVAPLVTETVALFSEVSASRIS
ncbi:MAG TPA: hypothetical protein VLB90_07920 [Pseudomonadales bacterium]|nr:hypothetical protein [Pseudomonadales bacterium]